MLGKKGMHIFPLSITVSLGKHTHSSNRYLLGFFSNAGLGSVFGVTVTSMTIPPFSWNSLFY